MLRCDNDLCGFGIGDEVHCAAHALEELAWDHEVGEITSSTDLEGLWRVVSFVIVVEIDLCVLTPRMETSTWPPRIMPKDSEESNVEAPGTKVTVCLPALTRSLFEHNLLVTDNHHLQQVEKSKTYGSTSSSVG